MASLPFHQHFPNTSQLIFGTMNLGGGWNTQPITAEDIKEAHALLEHCLDCGINVIDLADIYTFGKAETVIGTVFKQNKSLRQHFIIQSKVGIRLGPDVAVKHYDLSAKWITQALYASLERLQIDCLDVLFLHRGDPLMEVEPLGNALNNLYEQNKFDQIAVSNMHAGQMALLQSHLQMPIVANQLELSLKHSGFVEEAMTTNMSENAQYGFPRGTLEFCHQQNVQLQAWSPLAQGQFSNTEHENPNIRAAAQVIDKIATEQACSSSAVVLAWLMKHPAKIQPVIGSTKPSRISEASEALKVELSRQQWYEILQARRGQEVP